MIKYYMSKKQKKRYLNKTKNVLLDKKLNVKIINNGIILPAKEDYDNSTPKLWAIGGVTDEKGHYVKESDSGYLFGGNYEINNDYLEYNDETVIYFGPFIQHWGHFICDQISRLWYIIDEPQKYKIAYCGWNWNNGSSDMYGNFLELMTSLGIKESQLINIQRPTKFSKIIIPDFSFVGGKYYTKEFNNIIDKLTKNVLKEYENKKCPKNVYFTRTGLKNEKEYGEKYLINLLKYNNFSIFEPENLSFKDQLFYINNAENIAMISGSISHNLMFNRNKKNKSFIFNKTPMINNYQNIIDKFSDVNINYIDSYIYIKPVLFGEGPFIIYCNKYVNKCFEENELVYKKSTLKKFDAIKWFIKKYKNIYKNKDNKRWLKDQIKSQKNND